MPAADPGSSARLDLVNEHEALESFQRRVAAAMEHHGYPKASLFAVRLALHEALSNAIQHGHRGLPAATPIAVEFSVDPNHATFAIEDRGGGFDPTSIADPTLDENLEATSGRGLMLIRAYMTNIRFSKGGRRLELDYHKPTGAKPRG